MSCRLRKDQCCVTIRDGERCLAPARELGGHCTRCFRALSPAERAFLDWDAAHTIEILVPVADVLEADWDIVRAAMAMLGEGPSDTPSE